MTSAAFTARQMRLGRSPIGLLGAEILKLRKRRGLVLASVALTVAPMLVAYAVLALRHASDPASFGPAGSAENLSHAVSILTSLAAVAAVLIGVTVGAGDLSSGVFRELVITGRSRLRLYAARIPAGLTLLVPLVILGFAIPATASFALAGSEPTPAVTLVAHAGAVLVVEAVLAFVLALGIASLIGSRGTSIAILLGWQLALAPALVAIQSLDWVSGALPAAAIDRLAPRELGGTADVSLATAAVVIIAWTIAPLAAGAWRTWTRDA
jgi:hypothetical protein